MKQKIRWGILGTGNIAHSFATGLPFLPDAELLAVGSRSQATADAFGDAFGVPRRYASYEELVGDADVDVIYISTPHPFHRENTLLCLEAGKAVLCEKPFAMNAREAEEMIGCARSKKVFLMEAMWTRFVPVMVRLRELLRAAAIGEVRMVAADFGFQADFDPESRLFDRDMGGGALLDVGVYPVALASMVFGAPSEVVGLAHLGETGCDEQSAMLLGHPGGRLAILYTAIRIDTPQVATLMGTAGSITIHAPWWKPARLTLARSGAEPEVFDLPFDANGYNYEAAAVMEALRAGKLEDETMPLDETLAIMRTLDRIRAEWGLSYPADA